MNHKLITAIILVSLPCYAKEGDRLRAIIASVHDGDTCTALIYKAPGDWSRVEKIRLKDVWAPELKEPTLQKGREARDLLSKMVLGREVIIIDSGKRSFDRMVAEIELCGTNINKQLPSDTPAPKS